MENCIDLKKLSVEELAGVVNLYPWFGAARKEFCARMASSGGSGWGEEQYAESALYVVSRGKIARLLMSSDKDDCSDSEISEILKAAGNDLGHRKVRASGGDYFTQEQYDQVRRQEDSVFSGFVSGQDRPRAEKEDGSVPDLAFYTETLAQIYADQGYYEQAKDIYSKLILAYPEKNAYFAALIEKLNQEN